MRFSFKRIALHRLISVWSFHDIMGFFVKNFFWMKINLFFAFLKKFKKSIIFVIFNILIWHLSLKNFYIVFRISHLFSIKYSFQFLIWNPSSFIFVELCFSVNLRIYQTSSNIFMLMSVFFSYKDCDLIIWNACVLQIFIFLRKPQNLATCEPMIWTW